MGAPRCPAQTTRVNIKTLLRAAQILRAQPAHPMPLRALFAQLQRELGAESGTYTRLYLELKKRSDSFLLTDSPRLLDGANRWPMQVREAYDHALETAGLGAC